MSYVKGQWTVVCDVCGFEFLSASLKKRWDGLMVCDKDWEERHPLDLLRSRKETSQVLPWTRPEPADIYREVPYIFDNGSYWGPDYTEDREDTLDFYITPLS